MSILPVLVKAYEAQNLEVMTGYNPNQMHNWPRVPYTVFLEDNLLRGCPGLALQEVMFLEGLGKYLTPKNSFIIGNAFGWSTVATALTFPGSRTIGIDNSAKPKGRDLTNQIFEELSLDGGAKLGESPKGTAKICADNFDGEIDFVLIDAKHTNRAIVEDFQGVYPVCSKACVFLFHDVLNWKMTSGFEALTKESGLTGRFLPRTTSGMAIAYNDEMVSDDFHDYIDVFSGNLDLFSSYRQHAFKKMNSIRQAQGKSPQRLLK